jgi:hypothetical protein
MCKRKQSDLIKNAKPNERVGRFLPLDEDGIFGSLTEGALQMCYKSNTVDKALWERMNKAVPSLTV